MTIIPISGPFCDDDGREYYSFPCEESGPTLIYPLKGVAKMVEFTLGGKVVTMVVPDDRTHRQKATYEGGGWFNADCLIDNHKLDVGGGYFYDDDSAQKENWRMGFSTHLPGIHWPGAVEAGDFEPYKYDEIGQIEELADMTGVSVEEAMEAVQRASKEIAKKLPVMD